MKLLSFSEALSLKQDEPTNPRYLSKVGNSYKMLRVLHYAGKIKDKHSFVCKCECGNFCVRASSHLNSSAVSCGCQFNKNAIDGSLAATRRTDLDKAIAQIESEHKSIVICSPVAHTESAWNLLCKDHGVWSSKLRFLLRGSAHCPQCKQRSGFDKKSPATLYVFSVKDGDYPIALKFGITNKGVDQRKSQIETKSDNLTLDCIFSFSSDDGELIFSLEKEIKSNFKTKYLGKKLLPSGHTETISYENKDPLFSLIQVKIESFKTLNNIG